jgi:hypothetical protein
MDAITQPNQEPFAEILRRTDASLESDIAVAAATSAPDPAPSAVSGIINDAIAGVVADVVGAIRSQVAEKKREVDQLERDAEALIDNFGRCLTALQERISAFSASTAETRKAIESSAAGVAALEPRAG